MKVKFLKSGVQPADYPFPYKPEVAVVGRSNAGKSSFINGLVGSRIAKVSATPGKTRLLNFFEVGEKLYMVDMPGYGFATGNRKEVESWKKMIEAYLNERDTLKGVLLIMDIRRGWSDEEEMLKDWFAANEVQWGIVLTKSDKVSRSAMMQRQRDFSEEFSVPVFALSSTKKTGFDDVKNLVFKDWGSK